MQTVHEPSTFAQIVDKLRDKSEAELKQLYIQLSADNLVDEWKEITGESNVKDATEDDIVKTIQSKRYRGHV